MNPQKTFLVFGATGQTGKHFTELALSEGHRVRVLARTPGKLDGVGVGVKVGVRTSITGTGTGAAGVARGATGESDARANLEIRQGSITDHPDLDALVDGVDMVVSMLGDAQAQKTQKINTAFVRDLVPAMRRHGVTRFLYQAGGLSAPPHQRLSPALWAIRNTVARSYNGQHEDNEAVMRYLADEAMDIEWMVHRAGIGSDGPSKGVLERSKRRVSIATFSDCAAYNYKLLSDDSAVHTCDLSAYRRGATRD